MFSPSLIDISLRGQQTRRSNLDKCQGAPLRQPYLIASWNFRLTDEAGADADGGSGRARGATSASTRSHAKISLKKSCMAIQER
jgi:hypothetical protein